MKSMQAVLFAGAGLLALSNAAVAQQSSTKNGPAISETALEEVIVTARRKEERLQDVPATVNVATAEDLSKLDIRTFTDIQTLMPGLNLFSSGNTLGNAVVSVRGIDFNQFVSGNSNVIEFYLNDSPLPSTLIFQSIYDVGQVELLRGPQGTLRGRSSPAGSMTMTTRRPDFNEFGGYANATATDIGGQNINGAINIPIVNDMLAMRFAALWDQNEGDRVRSVNNPAKPYSRTKSARATVRFDPVDNLSFVLSFQHLELSTRNYTQVENVRVINGAPTATTVPGFPGHPSDIFIKAEDRLAVQDTGALADSKYDIGNLQAQWSFLGQRLNYVGNANNTLSIGTAALDVGDYFGPTDPAFLQGYAQPSTGHIKGQAHELRLSSEERLFGMLEYLVGAFYEQQDSPTSLRNATFLLAPVQTTIFTQINRTNFTKEQSYFGNLTLHLATGTEISGGARHIDYKASADLLQNGIVTPSAVQRDNATTNIWTASVKQRINDDLMVYGTAGTSWRPAITVIGDFNLAPGPLEQSFIHLAAEKSTSYEIGLKASAWEKRLQANLAFYHQTYDNSPYRSPTAVFFANTAFAQSPPAAPGTLAAPTPSAFNLAAAVPIVINGIEAELLFAPVKSWDLNLNASYAKSKIDNGLVPCNDYLPHDGVADTGSTAPTIGQIQAGANPGGPPFIETITGCRVNYRATQSPKFSSTAQSEYRMPFTPDLDGYVRGLLSYYGSTEGDPTNPLDDIDSYTLLNLYVGVRGSSGTWDVSLYGKNVTNKEVIQTRAQIPLSGAIRVPAVPFTTNYRAVSLNAPREFGVNFRWSFGSR